MSFLKDLAKGALFTGVSALTGGAASAAFGGGSLLGNIFGMSTFGTMQSLFQGGYEMGDSVMGAMGFGSMTPDIGPTDVLRNYKQGWSNILSGEAASKPGTQTQASGGQTSTPTPTPPPFTPPSRFQSTDTASTANAPDWQSHYNSAVNKAVYTGLSSHINRNKGGSATTTNHPYKPQYGGVNRSSGLNNRATV